VGAVIAGVHDKGCSRRDSELGQASDVRGESDTEVTNHTHRDTEHPRRVPQDGWVDADQKEHWGKQASP
jgi:hypothetical protein